MLFPCKMQAASGNSGTIAGRRLVDLGAQDIRHSGLIQGGEVHVQVDGGVHIDGGSITAGKALSIQAKTSACAPPPPPAAMSKTAAPSSTAQPR